MISPPSLKKINYPSCGVGSVRLSAHAEVLPALNIGRVRTPIPQENLGCFFIVNQINRSPLQNQDAQQTIPANKNEQAKSEEILAVNNSADKKQKFLQEYSLAKSTVDVTLFEKLKNFVNNLGRFFSNNMSAMINKIRSLFAQSGNNTSGFDSLMRELEHNKNNTAIANNQTQ